MIARKANHMAFSTTCFQNFLLLYDFSLDLNFILISNRPWVSDHQKPSEGTPEGPIESPSGVDRQSLSLPCQQGLVPSADRRFLRPRPWVSKLLCHTGISAESRTHIAFLREATAREPRSTEL